MAEKGPRDSVDASQVAPVIDGTDTQLATAVVETDVIPTDAHVDASWKGRDAAQADSAAADQPIEPPAGPRALPHLHPRSRDGFLHFYGWMGVPMVLIFLLSAMWTIMLAVIQQMPTNVANWLMDTEAFDQGEFWLLPKPDESISVPATLLLAVFAVGYVSLVVLMAFPDKLMHKSPGRQAKVETGSRLDTVRTLAAKVRGLQSLGPSSQPSRRHSTTIPKGWSTARLRYEVTSPHGILRQYYNPLLDLPKLIFQTTTLSTYLHDGFPIPIIAIYTSLLYVNWLVSSYRYQRERPDPHFVVCRIFYSFDLFFAVFAPLEVLVYANYNFVFDREAFAVRLETLSPGLFETTARLFADPTQVSLFRIAFHYLQFTSGPSLGVKSALNLLSIFKWWRTIVHLVEHAQASAMAPESLGFGCTDQATTSNVHRRRKRIQNFIIAATFFCAGSAVFAHSIGAVISTKHVCKPYEQCKVPSYQWNVGAHHCSCIVFVDRHPGLKTVAEWENPPDTSANLAALAHTGNLKIIQIINRKVPTLPDELRHCHHLEQLILLYTKIQAIPDWANEFSNLEYLHIQGDLTATQLTYLPPDLFHNMPHLNFLHLGSHIKLTALPDLSRLHHLEYLTFGMLHSITELPSLDGLINLHRFSIIDLIKLPNMPSVRNLKKLKAFSLLSRNPMCCNGFLTQACNLTDFSCKDRTAEGEPLVQCTTERIASEDYTRLTTTGGSVCPGGSSFDLKNNRQTLVNTDKACGGVLYKQCTLGTLSGICYPNLMQTLSCQINAGLVKMRRLEIARRVGEPCYPAVEAWLGSFILSSLWTVVLAAIQIAPNTVANSLMGTAEFDFGGFWLLSKAELRLAVPSTLALAMFALGYGYLALAMIFPDKLVGQPRARQTTASRWLSVNAIRVQSIVRSTSRPSRISDMATSIEPTPRRRLQQWLRWSWIYFRNNSDSAVFSLPKLGFQTATLITYLREGFPLALVFAYASLLFINWMLSCYRSSRGRTDPHTPTMRLLNSFDLFFAVFAPLHVLLYAYYDFKFDRDAFAVRLGTLPPGHFENTARLFADPTQVSLFRISFRHLAITSTTHLGIKMALNMLSIFKWWRTIVHLVEQANTNQTKPESLAHGTVAHAIVQHAHQRRKRTQQIQNFIIAATFFCAGSAVFAHSIGAVVSTKHVCKPYEQCKVPSYQWNVGAHHCSCIVFVDRHPGLKTLAEWENPPDTSANLAALAHTGNLKIIQIINRKVPTLPDELRHCHHLEQLILLYTKIQAIPDWANEFSNLEYLHIQGDLTPTQLTYLPPDLFHNMPHLNFLHLGSHIKLTTLPDLSRLHHLEYLTFGMLHSVTELPSFDGLINLHRFSIIDLIKLPKMPSVRNLKKLKAFSILSRNPMCCNGFLTQPCNLTDFSCKDRTAEGEPLVQCTTERIASEDYTRLKTTGGSVCPGSSSFDLKNNRQTLVNTDKACGGVMYKQCTLGTLSGICYPNLIQTLSCQINAGLVKMRRLEIERRVGEMCHPVVEAWLGCTG